MSREIYQTIIGGARSKVFVDMAKQTLAQANYLRMRSLALPGRLEDSIREWDRLTEAIAAGDGNTAAEALCQHLRNEGRAVVAQLRKEERQALVANAAVASDLS